MKSQFRNLNPTPEAIVAYIIWSEEYSKQKGGTMDFWDNLDEDRAERCRLVIGKLREKGLIDKYAELVVREIIQKERNFEHKNQKTNIKARLSQWFDNGFNYCIRQQKSAAKDKFNINL